MLNDIRERIMDDKTEKWDKIVSGFDFAFQPIVNTYTGKVFGLEALLRDYQKSGFKSISSVFDQAFSENHLVELDRILLEKATVKFAGINLQDHVKLFYNIDNRVVQLE